MFTSADFPNKESQFGMHDNMYSSVLPLRPHVFKSGQALCYSAARTSKEYGLKARLPNVFACNGLSLDGVSYGREGTEAFFVTPTWELAFNHL